MIYVATGTQDKQFTRLLKIVNNAVKKGIVKDKVIVQKGHTVFSSDLLEIIDFATDEEMDKYINDADLVVTHGGIGIITNALSKGKKVFAMARLNKYGEHINDHQVQIVEKFNKMGYLKRINDFDDFVREYQSINKFKPKKFKTDNSKMLDIISDFIG